MGSGTSTACVARCARRHAHTRESASTAVMVPWRSGRLVGYPLALEALASPDHRADEQQGSRRLLENKQGESY